jgi:hypothetical protein
MKKALILILAAALLCSCGGNKEWRIHGTVPSDKYEGVFIYLVPEGPHEPKEVDSCKIENCRFELSGKVQHMAILRMHRYYRENLQELLVATEPGDINVIIDAESKSWGTPQNDSLQVWKNATQEYTRNFQTMYEAGLENSPEIKQLQQDYFARSREIGHNCGDSSIVGKFMSRYYPEPKIDTSAVPAVFR